MSGTPDTPSSNGNKDKIYTALVAEDDVERSRAIEILKDMGLQVFSTTRGDEALTLFYTIQPDLMVLDVELPGMIGWDIVRAIRNGQHGIREPAFIFVTGYQDAGNRMMARLQGVCYLPKPINPDDFKAAVNRALKSRCE